MTELENAVSEILSNVPGMCKCKHGTCSGECVAWMCKVFVGREIIRKVNESHPAPSQPEPGEGEALKLLRESDACETYAGYFSWRVKNKARIDAALASQPQPCPHAELCDYYKKAKFFDLSEPQPVSGDWACSGCGRHYSFAVSECPHCKAVATVTTAGTQPVSGAEVVEKGCGTCAHRDSDNALEFCGPCDTSYSNWIPVKP